MNPTECHDSDYPELVLKTDRLTIGRVNDRLVLSDAEFGRCGDLTVKPGI